jgi:hypothetical protein
VNSGHGLELRRPHCKDTAFLFRLVHEPQWNVHQRVRIFEATRFMSTSIYFQDERRLVVGRHTPRLEQSDELAAHVHADLFRHPNPVRARLDIQVAGEVCEFLKDSCVRFDVLVAVNVFVLLQHRRARQV